MLPVSIVIPNNHRHHLVSALFDRLMEIREVGEIVFVDSSIDRHFSIEHAIAYRLGARFLHVRVEFALPGAARNLGINYVTLPIVALFDSRVLPHPESFRHNLALFAQNPTIEVIFGKRISDARTSTEKAIRDVLVGRNALLSLAGTLARTSVFKDIGLFNGSVVAGEDRDWILRVIASKRVFILDHLPNSTYEGFLNIDLTFQIAKWWRYHSNSVNHPIRKYQQIKVGGGFVIFLTIFLFGLFSNESAGTVALAIVTVLTVTYFIVRIIVMPLFRGVPLSSFLSLTYIANILVAGISLDVVRTAAVMSQIFKRERVQSRLEGCNSR